MKDLNIENLLAGPMPKIGVFCGGQYDFLERYHPLVGRHFFLMKM